jgi:predicted acylesterase/phospholipase RssA
MDNVFVPAPPTAAAYSTPGQVLGRFAGREAILIAASGGGIQAASWMAHVLHKMDEEQEIRSRVALISSVSGGSVGAYHLGDNWSAARWDNVENAVQESSLGPMTTALLGPDLFRPFVVWLPGGRHLDRGFALEDSIEWHHEGWMHRPPEYTLDDWAGNSTMPAILFNTTVVETGAPVAFATTALLTEDYREKVRNPMGVGHPVEGWLSFCTRHGDAGTSRNLKVSTAARLSATFPYVSPAARLEGAGKSLSYHFVDGGYYDNYGLVALMQWLDEALVSLAPEEMPASIRILVIRGVVPGEEAAKGKPADQARAPMEAFLNMRSYAQWRGAAAAMRLFKDKWRDRAKISEPELIAYPDLREVAPECSEQPLTWKLTTAQRACISVGWERWKTAKPKGGI